MTPINLCNQTSSNPVILLLLLIVTLLKKICPGRTMTGTGNRVDPT